MLCLFSGMSLNSDITSALEPSLIFLARSCRTLLFDTLAKNLPGCGNGVLTCVSSARFRVPWREDQGDLSLSPGTKDGASRTSFVQEGQGVVVDNGPIRRLLQLSREDVTDVWTVTERRCGFPRPAYTDWLAKWVPPPLPVLRHLFRSTPFRSSRIRNTGSRS